MRLFIAIELPASFKNEVARIQKEVKQLSSGGRFVPKENFHITLHFIGESEDIVGRRRPRGWCCGEKFVEAVQRVIWDGSFPLFCAF